MLFITGLKQDVGLESESGRGQKGSTTVALHCNREYILIYKFQIEPVGDDPEKRI